MSQLEEVSDGLIVVPVRQSAPVRLSQMRLWRRGFARLIDVSLHSFLVVLVGVIPMGFVAPEAAAELLNVLGRLPTFINQVLSVLLSIVPSTILLALTGGSVGKALLGVGVRRLDGTKPPFLLALKRELRVAWYGLALGVPYLSVGLAFLTFQDMRKKGSAKWDRELGLEVRYRDDSTLMWVMTGFGALISVGIAVLSIASGFTR